MAEITYEQLTAPFDGYFTAQGVFGPFLSGEQIVSRLNEVFGPTVWGFRVVKAEIDGEADEVVVLGELSIMLASGSLITKQQYGGQKVHRAREIRPLNLADDHKGAATDAMKKCASLLGVGPYMMVSQAEAHGGSRQRRPRQHSARTPTTARQTRLLLHGPMLGLPSQWPPRRRVCCSAICSALVRIRTTC